MLAQFLWNIVFKVGGHKELKALIVNRLKGNRKKQDIN